MSLRRGYDINLYTGFEDQVAGFERPYEENRFYSKGSATSMMKRRYLLSSVYESMVAIVEHQLSGKIYLNHPSSEGKQCPSAHFHI